MRLTRDSVILWWGLVSGIVAALAANAGVFPPEWQSWISTVGALVASISGWLKTSPLLGEHDISIEK